MTRTNAIGSQTAYPAFVDRDARPLRFCSIAFPFREQYFNALTLFMYFRDEIGWFCGFSTFQRLAGRCASPVSWGGLGEGDFPIDAGALSVEPN
jgi:hypothetical protein